MFNENKKIEKMNDNIIIDLVDNYNFEDITYGNDLCRSVGYKLDTYSEKYGGGNWGMFFQIFLTNSENTNYDKEEFGTYNILLCDEQSDNLIETYETDDFCFDTLEDVISFVLSNKDINKSNIIYEDDDDVDTDDLKDKCFCDYCDDFVPTSECETIDVNDDFEVACSECYNNLYKDNK